MNQPTNLPLKRLVALCSVLVILWAIYVVVSSILVYDKTGLLIVRTPNSSTAISVSSLNHGASILGTGNSKNRIVPGKYLVVAQVSGKSSSTVVTIYDKKTTSITINPANGFTLPSIYSISFSNSNYLLNQGISNEQLGLIEKSLFSFAPNAKNITFELNSVSYAPFDPNTSTSFTMYFSLKIDSTSYKAAINYSSISSLDLMLYNTSSVKIYDSGVVGS